MIYSDIVAKLSRDITVTGYRNWKAYFAGYLDVERWTNAFIIIYRSVSVFLNNVQMGSTNVQYYDQVCYEPHIWSNPTSYTPKHVGKAFEQRLNDTYIQTWKMTQSESSRFKLQAFLQEDYKMSPYLQTMMNIEYRQIITRLRLDMNSLHECMGRQKRPTDGFCPHCRPLIESVKHFIMECPFYSTRRSQLFEVLSQISNNF